MHTMRQLTATAAALTLSMLSLGPVSLADPGEATHIDELTAVVADDNVAVSGQATFVDTPVLIGQDPSGDAVAAQLPLGHDLTTATIGRPDPFDETVVFTLGVANQPPQVNGTPELIRYLWPITVFNAGQPGPNLTVEATRSSQGVCPASVDPCFRVMSYAGDGDAGLGQLVAQVPGTMANGVVQWRIPLSVLNAQPGSRIETPIFIRAEPGASGPGASASVFPAIIGALDRVLPTSPTYSVPGSTVRVGIAPADTPAEEVALISGATVEEPGGFTATVLAPAEAGEYIVVARACYGMVGDCGLATATVTITTP